MNNKITLEQKINYMKPEKWTGATVFITELEESSDERIISELEYRIVFDPIGKPNDLFGFSTWDLIEELEYRGYGEGYEEIINNCC